MIKHWLAGLAAVLSFGLAHAADAPLVEGQDYQLISPAQPTTRPDKIVVTEFFSYQCSHCYVFYPEVTPWAAKLPKDVVFERVPVSFGRPTWQPIAQTFYALQSLGKDGALDKAIFEAIHVQHAGLLDEASITRFVNTQGIKPEVFSAAYHSFSVEASTKRAEQITKAYKVQGTPTMVVNGKYIVLAEGTHGYAELLARVSRVIDKVRAERGGRK